MREANAGVRPGPGAVSTVMGTAPARSAGELLEELEVAGGSTEARSAR